MFNDFRTYGVAQWRQKKLYALATRKFHCRDKVAVAGDQDDDLYMLFQCQGSYVHPQTHVNAFLVDVGPQVFGHDCERRHVCRKPVAVQFPPAKCGHAQAKRKKWLLGQLRVKIVAEPSELRFTKAE